MNYKKKLEISTKGLTIDLRDKFNILDGAKYFSSGIFQNYLFIPDEKYIKYFNGTNQIYSWKSNGMSEESIENITTSNGPFAPTFVDHCILPDVNFKGHCSINNISIPKKQAFSGEAYDRTRTRPATRQSVQTCDKSHAQIKLDFTF